MIRRFGTVLSISVSFAVFGCFDGGSGDDEIADASTGEGESAGESESTTSSSTSEESATEASTESTSEASTDTSEESTTGDPEPVCGNGVVEGDEVCDDGPMPELMPGACAPDCSTVIETKHIAPSSNVDTSNFGPNPVAFADSRCPVGHKAMFVYGNQRVATTTPWQSVGSVDWPIQRYTAYVNEAEELVWVTDEVRLLAVRDGQHQAPINPLYPCDPCLASQMVTGMAMDGTNLVASTCEGWTSTNGAVSFSFGNFPGLELVLDTAACSADFPALPSTGFLCVEL